MKTFTVLCIEKNKTMQDMDARFYDLGSVQSVDGKDIDGKVDFNHDIWRICVITEIKKASPPLRGYQLGRTRQ
jgi:hypothetical protein